VSPLGGLPVQIGPVGLDPSVASNPRAARASVWNIFFDFLRKFLASVLIVLGMPDNLAFDEVDDFLGNISGVIRQPFDVAGNQQQVD
jgi:hypothetical protein